MKRYGHLHEKICEMDNILLAHRNARKGKGHYKEVQQVNEDPERYCRSIQLMLDKEIYRTSPYKVFTKTDGKKPREIYVLPYYPDRIIHWAIVQVLEPIWMRTFIGQTYSSLKGRGIHKGLVDIQAMLQDKQGTKYCLKFDVRKFYPSIDHSILKQLLRRKIKDDKVLRVLDEIIDSVGGERNVPIGNYLSQYLSNVYLSGFDHWIKEEMGAANYLRYCDDCVVLHGSKEFLHDLRIKAERYLNEQLHLEMKDDWQVFPTDVRGVDFLGYRFFRERTLLRKSIALDMMKSMRKLHRRGVYDDHARSCIGSYEGWMGWCDSEALHDRHLDPVKAALIMNG